MSGFAQPGTMTVIMGNSGCGKTVLLDKLSGRLSSAFYASGNVLVNGSIRSNRYIKRICGYVLQSDVLFSQLTVRETLLYAAELKCESSITIAEKIRRVDETISDLELSHVANTKVGGDEDFEGGLSGGQKRRLSIALELVSCPSVLLLDGKRLANMQSQRRDLMRILPYT